MKCVHSSVVFFFLGLCTKYPSLMNESEDKAVASFYEHCIKSVAEQWEDLVGCMDNNEEVDSLPEKIKMEVMMTLLSCATGKIKQ